MLISLGCLASPSVCCFSYLGEQSHFPNIHRRGPLPGLQHCPLLTMLGRLWSSIHLWGELRWHLGEQLLWKRLSSPARPQPSELPAFSLVQGTPFSHVLFPATSPLDLPAVPSTLLRWLGPSTHVCLDDLALCVCLVFGWWVVQCPEDSGPSVHWLLAAVVIQQWCCQDLCPWFREGKFCLTSSSCLSFCKLTVWGSVCWFRNDFSIKLGVIFILIPLNS